MILPLCSALARHIWSAGSSVGVPSTGERDILERLQSRTTKMFEKLEHLLYRKRLRELRLFSEEKRSLGEDLINVY